MELDLYLNQYAIFRLYEENKTKKIMKSLFILKKFLHFPYLVFLNLNIDKLIFGKK